MTILKTILSLVLFAFLTSFNFGEPIAILKCKSETGRTVFYAVIPNCTYLESANFSIDSSKYTFNYSDYNGIIFDPENKVFTIYLETKGTDIKRRRYIKFWALPDTFLKVKNEKGPGSQFHDMYEFRAKIYGTEPRTGYEATTKTIELICTLDYSL